MLAINSMFILKVPYLILIAIVTYLATLIIYRVFLHPLARYSGPLTAKFTGAYIGFHTYKRRLHLTAWQNHLKYGPVVRQGPNKLVFSTITATRDIYRTDLTTKPKAYMTLGPGLTKYNVLTAPDNHLHRTRRQLVGQALTDRSLRAFEPTMIKQIDIFIRNALSSAQRSQYFNITEEARRLGLDIAGLLSFGYDLRLQTDEQHRFMPTMLTAGTFWSSVFLQYPNARKFRFGLIAVQAFRKLHEPYLSLMQKMISSHMAEEKEAKHDLFSHIAHAFSVDVESDGLRDSDLWSEANLFLTAAGDTVKTSISAVFFYLSRNADPYQKLADEIRTTFQNGSEINGQTIAGCQYLRACVDEALRMSPPAAGILWREQASETRGQPLIVDGHVIPEGTVIGVNIYSLHHNEEYFPDSFTYRPERWVEELDPEVKKRMREAFIPFSIGPRGCAGKSMAYLETCLVIAKSLWYFDFEAAPGSLGRVGEGQPGMELGRERKEEFQLYDTFTSMHEGPYLKFQPRGNYWKDLAKNE